MLPAGFFFLGGLGGQPGLGGEAVLQFTKQAEAMEAAASGGVLAAIGLDQGVAWRHLGVNQARTEGQNGDGKEEIPGHRAARGDRDLPKGNSAFGGALFFMPRLLGKPLRVPGFAEKPRSMKAAQAGRVHATLRFDGF